MPKTSSAKPVKELTYESASTELEAIVAALESEQRSLDEAMSLYERGQSLIKRCAELLDRAELKVKKLSGGELVEFEEEE